MAKRVVDDALKAMKASNIIADYQIDDNARDASQLDVSVYPYSTPNYIAIRLKLG